VIAAALVGCSSPVGSSSTPAQPEPWRHVASQLEEERGRMAGQLERAHGVLLERARAEGRDELVDRLEPEPPRPRPTGYGMLPELLENAEPKPVELTETRYSLERLSMRFARSGSDAALLARRVAADPGLPLEPWVDEFERLRDEMRNLEEHLDYHETWQIEVPKWLAYFQDRNGVIADVHGLEVRRAAGAPDEEIETRRRSIVERVAPFRPVPGLALADDGELQLLTVPLVTDIEDDAFLDQFVEAVEGAFSSDAAPRQKRFALRLEIEHVAPAVLYPEGVPALGAAIDCDGHLARFAPRSLILTTGAESTFALPARAVLLGSGPIERRVLAHEFAHLIGFTDAYVRGFEGTVGASWGVELIEWTGLTDDLMGDPAAGAVSDAMVERLLEGYDASPDLDN
jgi:hypothetical protein